MDTAQSFHTVPAEPAELGADTSASFWTGAPKLVAGLATLLGSIVALTTVLVQAGVIGSPGKTVPTVPTVQTTSARTMPTVPVVEPTPSLAPTLRELNALLAESARTKGDLGTLIAGVQADPPALARDSALVAIEDVIEQRRQLHTELAAFDPPGGLARAVALLRESITASLADDRLVRQWIVARYDGDPAAGRLWQAQREASTEASRAKDAFRAEYAERLRTTGLPDVIPNY